MTEIYAIWDHFRTWTTEKKIDFQTHLAKFPRVKAAFISNFNGLGKPNSLPYRYRFRFHGVLYKI